jgi:hypothetical protein
MLKTETQKIEREIVVGFSCDRCGKEVLVNENPMAYQESHQIRFTGGYSSVFGDGATVECDLCQDCLKTLIGEFCRIS